MRLRACPLGPPPPRLSTDPLVLRSRNSSPSGPSSDSQAHAALVLSVRDPLPRDIGMAPPCPSIRSLLKCHSPERPPRAPLLKRALLHCHHCPSLSLAWLFSTALVTCHDPVGMGHPLTPPPQNVSSKGARTSSLLFCPVPLTVTGT